MTFLRVFLNLLCIKGFVQRFGLLFLGVFVVLSSPVWAAKNIEVDSSVYEVEAKRLVIEGEIEEIAAPVNVVLVDGLGEKIEGKFEGQEDNRFEVGFEVPFFALQGQYFLSLSDAETTLGPLPLDIEVTSPAQESEGDHLADTDSSTKFSWFTTSFIFQGSILIGALLLVVLFRRYLTRMTVWSLFLIILVAGGWMIWSDTDAPEDAKPSKIVREQTSEGGEVLYAAGEIVVQFDPETLNLQSAAGVERAGVWGEAYDLTLTDTLNLSHIGYFSFKQSQEALKKVKEKIQEDPAVMHVDWNYQLETQLNDPHANPSYPGSWTDSQWYLYEAPQVAQAWEYIESFGNPLEEVVIAVIDTGIDYTHPDLQGSLWDGSNCKDHNGNFLGNCLYGYDYYAGDADPMHEFKAGTKDDHGTAVAGVIGMEHNNGIGGAGIAPNVKIMSLKVSGAANNNYMDSIAIQKAVGFAIANGADIINMSYGYIENRCDNEFESWHNLMRAVYGSFSGLLFAAAGNTGQELRSDGRLAFPASLAHGTDCFEPLPNMLSIGASTRDDQRASFIGGGSNYGDVSLMAPGLFVFGPVSSSSPNRAGASYYPVSGTSTASPFAAGVAALVMGFDSSLSASAYKQLLVESGDTVPAFGNGVTVSGKRINALNAVRSIPSLETIRIAGGQVILRFTVPVTATGDLSLNWLNGIGNYVSGSGTKELTFELAEGQNPALNYSYQILITKGSLTDSRGITPGLMVRGLEDLPQATCAESIFDQPSLSNSVHTVSGCINGDLAGFEYDDGGVVWKCRDGLFGGDVLCRMNFPAITWCDYEASLQEFGTITSPETGRIWMDRNLGATTSGMGADSYGCLFQWGRDADGHHEVGYDADEYAYIARVNKDSRAVSTQNAGSAIYWGTGDWKQSFETNLWAGLEAPNQVCPDGFRVPTPEEWQAEGVEFRALAQIPVVATVQNDFEKHQWIRSRGGPEGYWTDKAGAWTGVDDNRDWNASLMIGNDGNLIETWGSNLAPVRCIQDEDIIPIVDPALKSAISRLLDKPWAAVRITDVPDIIGLKVQNQPISTFTGLDVLTSLERLELRNVGIEGSIPFPILNIPSLKYLDLAHNDITGVIPVEIRNLPNLEFLNIANNQFTGNIESFTSEVFETLIACGFTDEENVFEGINPAVQDKIPPTASVGCIDMTLQNRPPVITAGQSFFVYEGVTQFIVEAVDADGDPLQLWEIFAGNDDGLFDIDESGGIILFNPAQLSTGETYQLQMTVSDGTDRSAPETITIQVAPDERPTDPNEGRILFPIDGAFYTSVAGNPNNVIEFELEFDDPFYPGGIMVANAVSTVNFIDAQLQFIPVGSSSGINFFFAPALVSIDDNRASFVLSDALTTLDLAEGQYHLRLVLNAFENFGPIEYVFSMPENAVIHIDNTPPELEHEFPDGNDATDQPVMLVVECNDDAGVENIGCLQERYTVEISRNYCADSADCDADAVRVLELCDRLGHCGNVEVEVDWYEGVLEDNSPPELVSREIFGLPVQGFRLSREGIDGGLSAASNGISGDVGNRPLAANEEIVLQIFTKDIVPDESSIPPYICHDWSGWAMDGAVCKPENQ